MGTTDGSGTEGEPAYETADGGTSDADDTTMGEPDYTADVDCAAAAAGPCEKTACVAGECAVVDRPDGGSCDHGKLCTEDDECLVGMCGGTPIDCDEASGERLAKPLDGLNCDDMEPCTIGDLCGQALCAPGEFTCDCEADTDCAAQEDGCRSFRTTRGPVVSVSYRVEERLVRDLSRYLWVMKSITRATRRSSMEPRPS